MLPRAVVTAMTARADAALGDAMVRISGAMNAPPRTEVGLVAAVTIAGISAIASGWRPLLRSRGLRLSLTGVFCHAAPLVQYAGRAMHRVRCELADLLVVTDCVSGASMVRRASLVQAKMASSASAFI